MSAPVTDFILLNLGTPAAPTPGGVRDFLREFLSDDAVVDYPAWAWQPILRGMILRSRPHVVARQYASIWTANGSPLRVITERLTKAVRAAVPADVRVHGAYRYGEPSLDTVMANIANRSTPAGRVVVTPLFPQRTGPTTGTAAAGARDAARRARLEPPLVRLLHPDDQGYIDALAERWRDATRGAPPDQVLMSFHGIPRRFHWKERGVYARDCERTAQALLARTRWPAGRATLCYQSKFGPEPWLTPSTADLLASLPGRGVRSVAVIAPGFVTDGLETLEELGIRGRDAFLAAGGERFVLVDGVNDHPRFVAALAALALPDARAHVA